MMPGSNQPRGEVSREPDLQNFYLSPQTYQAAFREAGGDFRWVDVSLQPSARGNPFWDEFMRRSPVVGFVATR